MCAALGASSLFTAGIFGIGFLLSPAWLMTELAGTSAVGVVGWNTGQDRARLGVTVGGSLTTWAAFLASALFHGFGPVVLICAQSSGA